jgi:hypothetical protein
MPIPGGGSVAGWPAVAAWSAQLGTLRSGHALKNKSEWRRCGTGILCNYLFPSTPVIAASRYPIHFPSRNLLTLFNQDVTVFTWMFSHERNYICCWRFKQLNFCRREPTPPTTNGQEVGTQWESILFLTCTILQEHYKLTQWHFLPSQQPVFRIRIRNPDPHVFGPPGSGSTSQR